MVAREPRDRTGNDVAVQWRDRCVGRRDGRWPGASKAGRQRKRSRRRGESQHPNSRMVGDVRDLCCFFDHRPVRTRHSIRRNLVPRAAGIYHARADSPRRSSRFVVDLLHHYTATISVCWSGMVWTVHDPDSCLRLLAYPHLQRHGRRA